MRNSILLEDHLPILLQTTLFRGLSLAELRMTMECFQPAARAFSKGEIVLLSGYEMRDVGIVLAGQVEAVKNTPDGGSVAITLMEPGSLFGDVLSGSSTKSPVTVIAKTDCQVLFVPYQKILHPCARMHGSHFQLMQNLVCTISDKYFALNRRVDLLILKSLRSKLCAYLLEEAARAGADTFTIPFSRAGLADYLNCERSALSREISRMRDEGLIETYKNSFKLLNKAELTRQYHC